MHLSVCFYVPRSGITEFIVLSLFRHRDITNKIPKAHRRNVNFPFLLLTLFLIVYFHTWRAK